MDVMKEISRQVGLKTQTLEVRESNAEAIKLYRKCGFVVKGRRPLYYADTHEDALIMWADV
jgi:ribosomal-protein-alanine N-acetyltransferase